MQRDIGLYGALLATGLGLAYWASLPKPEGSDEKVQIFAIDPKAVAEVTYKSQDQKTKVTIATTATKRSTDDLFWVVYNKTEPGKTPPAPQGPTPPTPEAPQSADSKSADANSKDPKLADSPSAAQPSPDKAPEKAPDVVTTERFLGGEKVGDIVKGLNPLTATRVWKKVSDEQLAEFGLKDSTQSFAVKGKDGQGLTLRLGRRSYGSASRFVQEELAGGQWGRIFLIEDEAFEDLDRAPIRLYERRLVSFDLNDAQKATITAMGQDPKRLSHTQRDKNGELVWTDDEEGAQPKTATGGWMERVAKLRLLSFASETEEPQAAAIKPFLEIALEKDGKVVDTIKFKKETKDGKAVYWVTSDFLGSHVKVPPARVEPIERDVGSVFSAPKS